MSLGAPEIILILIAVLLLFGYKKLPDASRSIGRSLRIFKGEMKGIKDDDVRGTEPATTTPVRGELVAPGARGPSSVRRCRLARRRGPPGRAARRGAPRPRRAGPGRPARAATAEGPR